MQNYGDALAGGNDGVVRYAGATNGSNGMPVTDKNPGGMGTVPPVVGGSTPIVASTGATNNGKSGS